LYGDHQKQQDRDYHVLTIRIPPTLHENIDRIARADGETVASVVRRMLRAGIEHRQAAHV
jgi:hypothetical protein